MFYLPKILVLGLAIMLQIKEHVLSPKKILAHSPAIVVQTKVHYLVYLKILSLVWPFWYRLKSMLHPSQIFVLGSAIAVQTKEHVISILNFRLRLGHRGTSQGACMVLVSTIPLNVACASSY